MQGRAGQSRAEQSRAGQGRLTSRRTCPQHPAATQAAAQQAPAERELLLLLLLLLLRCRLGIRREYGYREIRLAGTITRKTRGWRAGRVNRDRKGVWVVWVLLSMCDV